MWENSEISNFRAKKKERANFAEVEPRAPCVLSPSSATYGRGQSLWSTSSTMPSIDPLTQIIAS
jgi:hypothetical protein